MATSEESDPPVDDRDVDLDPEVEPAPGDGGHARATLPHGVLVAVGGVLGTLARDLLLRAAPGSVGGFPWMLASLNVVGAAALGLLVARVLGPRPHAVGARLFLATGVLGGFTTYSSLVAAAVVRSNDGHLAVAFATLLGTAVVGVAAAWLGGRTRRAAT